MHGDWPLISCICPTYNRCPEHLHLLEEATESFLRQDYPRKELIILNDTPGQGLICEEPGVVVVNVPERFATLGAKCNAAVRMSNGTLIAPWDDDDISLPGRLSFSFERLADGDYFNPRGYWMLDYGQLVSDHQMGYAHNCSLFTREAFERVGGYREEISIGYDRDIDAAFGTVLERGYDPWKRGSSALTPGEWFYIYRWGVSPGHVSSETATDDGLYGEIGERPVTEGWFRLFPAWQQDYPQVVRDALTPPGKRRWRLFS